ncbi:TPA: hypothetical protein ACIKXX_001348 [Campylobacter jejuni]
MLEVKLDLRPDIKKMLEIAFERNYSKSYASFIKPLYKSKSFDT